MKKFGKKYLTVLFTILISVSMLEAKTFKVVLDPGHGGPLPGAVSVKKNREKDINLAVAKKVSEMLKNAKDIEVIMTRNKDVDVDLPKRSDIANNANADLFISIHCNSENENNANRGTLYGSEIYVIGAKQVERNLHVVMRENQAQELNGDHIECWNMDDGSIEAQIISEMFQERNFDKSVAFAKEAGKELASTAKRKYLGIFGGDLSVLRRAKMPAVLIELDYMSNSEADAFLGSEEGQEQLARAISNAIISYSSHNVTKKK